MTDNNRDRDGFFKGAVLGALAGAAAVIFLNEEKREEVRKKINQAVSTGEGEVARLRQEIIKLKADLKEKTAQELKKATKKLSS